jgi:drug/metabolite transporter (DMT)-like permease
MALAGGSIDATSFGTIRLIAGAVMLAALSIGLRGGLRLGGPGRVVGVAALLLYIYGFSGAYTVLDAGLGALILFGVVQITMFADSIIAREAIPLRRALGAALAFSGLVWLLWPGAGPQVSVLHGLMMAAAGLGWGIYSLAGRRSTDALQGTAANFALAAPLGLVLSLLLPASGGVRLGAEGIMLAVLSGAVTSGLGYALWYRVLPDLPSSVAAVAQLTVPVIAMVGGVLLLGETLGLPLIVAGAVVLGGVALSVLPFRGRR